MRARLLAGLILAGFLAWPSVAGAIQGMPFVGVWDCEVGVFTFTNQTYNPGDQMLVIKDVAIEDGNYLLTFEDGYQIGLSSVTETSMAWLSGESGDGFTCKRLYD